jgi:phospholipase/carboxylesterase
MWVFAPHLPRSALLVAPRAPYVSNHPEIGGYSWVERRAGEFSELPAFNPALDAFNELLTKIVTKYPSVDISRFGMVGFSQGAAFCFAYAMRNPQRVSRLAALAGYLPPGSEGQLSALAKMPVFIAHGINDETVPITKAHAARDELTKAGVNVQYCEAHTGHKLGANCFAQLAGFFRGEQFAK